MVRMIIGGKGRDVQRGQNAPPDVRRAARWRELRLEYLSEAARLAAAAMAIVRSANDGPLDDDARRSLRLLAHRSRGSAGFFEFESVVEAAAALEDAVLAGAEAAALAVATGHLQEQIQSATQSLEP